MERINCSKGIILLKGVQINDILALKAISERKQNYELLLLIIFRSQAFSLGELKGGKLLLMLYPSQLHTYI